MLRLAFDFIIAWRETRTRPNAYLLTMFKLKKMKDREFSTKKLAESIKVLRKASGVNVKEFCKSIHMTERSYYSALKSKLTI